VVVRSERTPACSRLRVDFMTVLQHDKLRTTPQAAPVDPVLASMPIVIGAKREGPSDEGCRQSAPSMRSPCRPEVELLSPQSLGMTGSPMISARAAFDGLLRHRSQSLQLLDGHRMVPVDGRELIYLPGETICTRCCPIHKTAERGDACHDDRPDLTPSPPTRRPGRTSIES